MLSWLGERLDSVNPGTICTTRQTRWFEKMVSPVFNLTSWHLSISFHRVCQSSVPHSECTFTVIWVNYLYKQAMHLLHLELEISGCTPEVNERFCISACCSWLLSGQVLWCSQKLWCEVALAKPAVLQNCVVAVPEPREKKLLEIPWEGSVCWGNLGVLCFMQSIPCVPLWLRWAELPCLQFVLVNTVINR